MGAAADLVRDRMTVAEFLEWGEARDGAFELVRGRVVAKAPEIGRHARAKLRIVNTLARLLAEAGSCCEAMIDGVGLRASDDMVRVPDVVIECGAVDDEDRLFDKPVVVVEIASPSTHRTDVGAKVTDYLSLDTVAHYLVVDAARRNVVWYRREGNDIGIAILTEGEIALDPPGITVAVADLVGAPNA